MKRKLTRKLKKKTYRRDSINPTDPLNPVEKIKKPLRKIKKKFKRITKYNKQKCAFVKNGNQCKRNAVGKSTLCKKHGGDPIVPANLVKKDEHHLIGINTKFDPGYHPLQFIDLSRSGLSDVEIAAEFQVGITTLRDWNEKFAEFNLAYEIGQALHETWWLQQGKNGLRDRSFNTNLFKFLTGNKLGYSEKIESKNLNMNIHGVLMVPDAVTEEQWEEDIVDVDS